MSKAKSLEVALVSGRSPEEIHAEILERLKERLREIGGVYRANGKPSKRALEEQAAFLAGAIAAMHGVFGSGSTLIPEVCPHTWFFSILRGELVVEVKP